MGNEIPNCWTNDDGVARSNLADRTTSDKKYASLVNLSFFHLLFVNLFCKVFDHTEERKVSKALRLFQNTKRTTFGQDKSNPTLPTQDKK